jgi:hypothetical protein
MEGEHKKIAYRRGFYECKRIEWEKFPHRRFSHKK